MRAYVQQNQRSQNQQLTLVSEQRNLITKLHPSPKVANMEGVVDDKSRPGGKVIFSGVMKSDEFETPSSQKTEKTLPSVSSESDDGGIDIPHFLQPLLGMDFMPFMQRSASGESLSPKSAPTVLEPKTRAIGFKGEVTTEEVNVAPNEKHKSADVLDGRAQEYAEIIESAKKQKKKKTILRLLRKSLGGKSKSSSQPAESQPAEDVNLSMSTCESFSLQSLNVSFDCDDDSVLTGSLLDTSTLDTSIDLETSVDYSQPSSTPSKKSKGLRIFKRKAKKSKAISSKNESLVNPGAQDTLKWLQTQQGNLQNHQSELHHVQSDMLTLQQKSNGIQKRILGVTDEITALQSALQMAEMNLRNELNNFEAAKTEMASLERSAEKAAKAVLESFKLIQIGPSGQVKSITPATPSHAVDAATAPTPKIANSESTRQETSFQEIQSDSEEKVESNAFMRVHDFNLGSSTASDSPGFLFVDDNLKPIVENLAKLGLDHIRDESDRFKATRDTKKTLSKYEEKGIPTNTVNGKDVLVWMGDCGHKNHGCKWPVVKARGLINTSPKELAEFMLDSSRIKEYNEMSQGRDDVVVFQQDLHTTAEESKYGVPGTIKVLRSRNKPKLLPKAVEITSLLYSKPLEDCPGAYMLVNRSIFEDDKGTLTNNKEIITSEMLLGVNLIRPVGDDNTMCEFNSITHIFPPGVPEFLAKKVAPSSALNMIKDIQKVFD